MINNLRKNLKSNKKTLKIKVNTNEHIRLTLIIGLIAFVSGVFFINNLSIGELKENFETSYNKSFNREVLTRKTFIEILGYEPKDHELAPFAEEWLRPLSPDQVFLNYFGFFFFYITPIVIFLFILCYPRNQPIVCDRERRVIYTVSFNRLYIFQLQNLDKRYYTPITFLKMDNKTGVFQPVDGALHDSLHVNLQRADKPEVIKTFRCGSIPVVDAYFGKVIRDFVADYFYGDLDEKDLYQSKNSFSILDPIRWFFDYPLCYYRDRTRDKKILARVDQYIADNPKPFISDGTPSKEQVVAEHNTKKGNYHRYYNGLIPDYD
ncbi:hypothetical protein [Neptunomonas phycophila]|uniref:hypothetical protein n=2 Tax=Neptunomonas phycophila TaxID=1572645 RepID=UPI0009490F51|nr:hypothetical protein [Neptunomonas phycophila]